MLYISSSCFSKDKIKDAVLELVRFGLLNIELGGGTKYYQGIEGDLLNLKKRYKINFLIHNYFPPTLDNFVMNIASKDRYLRDKTFKFIGRAIRLAKKLGVNLYTIHSGFNKSLVRENGNRFYAEVVNEANQGKQNTKEDFYQGIDSLLNNVVKKDIRIGIENSFPCEKSLHTFLDSREDIMEFLDYYKEIPNIGLLLDLGHLNVASTSLGFDKFDTVKEIFTDYSDKIFEIHMSENDGSNDAHGVCQPDCWQVGLFRQYKEKLGDIPIVFEWRNSLNNQISQYFIALKKLLEN